MSGVDFLIDRGLVDSEKMAVRGWSYGGILGGTVISKTNRFKAASLGALVSDWRSEYEESLKKSNNGLMSKEELYMVAFRTSLRRIFEGKTDKGSGILKGFDQEPAFLRYTGSATSGTATTGFANGSQEKWKPQQYGSGKRQLVQQKQSCSRLPQEKQDKSKQ